MNCGLHIINMRSTSYGFHHVLYCDRIVTSRYEVIDPNEAIIAQIARYNSNIVTHPWTIILRQ